jgi:hypothetical protein
MSSDPQHCCNQNGNLILLLATTGIPWLWIKITGISNPDPSFKVDPHPNLPLCPDPDPSKKNFLKTV